MSLRRRLLLGFTAVVLVLVAADLALATTFRGYLVGRVDNQLVDTAGRFTEATLGPPRRGPGSPGGPPRSGDGPRPLSDYYLGLATADGTLQGRLDQPLRTGQAPPEPSPQDVLAAVASPGEAPQPFSATGPGGSAWRLLALQPAGEGGDILLVGASLEDIEATVRRMTAVLVAATLAVLATLAVVAWWVLRQGVRPLDAMTATAEAIAGGALHERVADVDDRTEAGRLGIALNAMLGRIEAAFAERAASERRLRRFVADASHELRTPLTSIRGYAELHRAGALAEPDALDGAMRRIEQEAQRMGVLVEDLLLLAKLDQGRPLVTAPVDLAVIARDAAADLRAVEPGRPVAVDAAEVVVHGDEARLRQVVGNLLANARAHTPPATPVRVRVGTDGAVATVEVADDGPGMRPEVAERAFERFYRADPARARSGGAGEGAGLGLAIVASIVEAHGGTVDLVTAPGRGARVILRIPRDVAPTG